MTYVHQGGLVLALDTSTVVSVGLARDGRVVAAASVSDRMAHVEQLTPLIGQCLATAGATLAEVSRMVVGLGPGPFTGLRVGIITAQVLASVRQVALRGVCSLDVLAVQFVAEQFVTEQGRGAAAASPGDFVVATDARRKEVYWARYDADGTRRDGPHVTSPDQTPRLPTIGPASDLYPDRLPAVDGPRVLDPGVLAVHGWSLPDAGREPLYLRRPDAAEPARRKSVLHHRPGRP
jgi:tRNA threonylcarbamoyl adenosine modification protein YeaZ